MCGFAGFLEIDGARGRDERARVAQAMADRIETRGPDDSGVWADPSAGYAVGFRRLSILDLSSAGHQPMVSADGRFVLSFNGEVYNAPELRPDLEAGGLRFRGHSDTEVVLEACAAWGVSTAIRRFVGMFAFALWDTHRGVLTLVRDRLGIKPLFWGRTGRSVLFASQPKSFFPYPGWRADVDGDSLRSYLRFGYVPAPRSMLRGMFKLRPGTLLEVDADGREREECYWSVDDVAASGVREPVAFDDAEAEAQLEVLMRDAVRMRMLADVPLGAFLSGGVDSSAVVALMQAQSGIPVRSFSIGFRESDFDEAPHARAVAAHLGTDHTELYVEPRHALEVVPDLPEWFDEPLADSSQIPTYLVSRLTREHVTVALSGDGGDELFAGYTRYGHALDLTRQAAAVPGPLAALARSVAGVICGSALQGMARRLPLGGRYAGVCGRIQRGVELLSPEGRDRLYRDLVSYWHDPAGMAPGGAEPVDSPWDGSLVKSLSGFAERMQCIDMLTYLPDDILSKVDRASMATSLEARVPLLDHRVVEFAWRLPARFRVRDGVSKWLLRQVLYRHVPRELIERPKMGFGIPIGEWLRGPLRDWAEDLLGERHLGDQGLLDPAPIRQRWREHLSEEVNWQYPLWAILMFQAWYRRWVAA